MRSFVAKLARAFRPGSRAPAGKVTIAYTPDRDGDADPGEVVWAWVPYEEDVTQGKDRPVLIVGWDGPQLVGVPLSSRTQHGRRDASSWIAVGVGAWDRERRPSYTDAERLLRFAPHGVRREGAALDRTRFDAVVARVRQLHGPAAFSRDRG